ncbi:hypothetical protein G9C98_003513 [Cotesia typhae]|uniref:Chitin-binding type-2 domain-containing protein n=1 Tax=Cotesia typhae TaxID=2053667 RepID=A0A8J5QUB0_9HYME|nr:hypothetical protein G9C98_003513 [Cotesia typhae]
MEKFTPSGLQHKRRHSYVAAMEDDNAIIEAEELMRRQSFESRSTTHRKKLTETPSYQSVNSDNSRCSTPASQSQLRKALNLLKLPLSTCELSSLSDDELAEILQANPEQTAVLLRSLINRSSKSCDCLNCRKNSLSSSSASDKNSSQESNQSFPGPLYHYQKKSSDSLMSKASPSDLEDKHSTATVTTLLRPSSALTKNTEDTCRFTSIDDDKFRGEVYRERRNSFRRGSEMSVKSLRRNSIEPSVSKIMRRRFSEQLILEGGLAECEPEFEKLVAPPEDDDPDDPDAVNARKKVTLQNHYYPEGFWGYVIVIVGVIVQLLSHGLQTAFGILLALTVRQFNQSVINTGFHKVSEDEFKCPGRGYFEHPNDCAVFYHCDTTGFGPGLKAHKHVCGPGTVYSLIRKRCMLPRFSGNVKCQNYKWGSQSNHLEYGVIGSPWYLQKTNPVVRTNNEPSCIDEGFMADPSDCQKFYLCMTMANHIYNKFAYSCPINSVWENEKQWCMASWATMRTECRSGSSGFQQGSQGSPGFYQNGGGSWSGSSAWSQNHGSMAGGEQSNGFNGNLNSQNHFDSNGFIGKDKTESNNESSNSENNNLQFNNNQGSYSEQNKINNNGYDSLNHGQSNNEISEHSNHRNKETQTEFNNSGFTGSHASETNNAYGQGSSQNGYNNEYDSSHSLHGQDSNHNVNNQFTHSENSGNFDGFSGGIHSTDIDNIEQTGDSRGMDSFYKESNNQNHFNGESNNSAGSSNYEINNNQQSNNAGHKEMNNGFNSHSENSNHYGKDSSQNHEYNQSFGGSTPGQDINSQELFDKFNNQETHQNDFGNNLESSDHSENHFDGSSSQNHEHNEINHNRESNTNFENQFNDKSKNSDHRENHFDGNSSISDNSGRSENNYDENSSQVHSNSENNVHSSSGQNTNLQEEFNNFDNQKIHQNEFNKTSKNLTYFENFNHVNRSQNHYENQNNVNQENNVENQQTDHNKFNKNSGNSDYSDNYNQNNFEKNQNIESNIDENNSVSQNNYNEQFNNANYQETHPQKFDKNSNHVENHYNETNYEDFSYGKNNVQSNSSRHDINYQENSNNVENQGTYDEHSHNSESLNHFENHNVEKNSLNQYESPKNVTEENSKHETTNNQGFNNIENQQTQHNEFNHILGNSKYLKSRYNQTNFEKNHNSESNVNSINSVDGNDYNEQLNNNQETHRQEFDNISENSNHIESNHNDNNFQDNSNNENNGHGSLSGHQDDNTDKYNNDKFNSMTHKSENSDLYDNTSSNKNNDNNINSSNSNDKNIDSNTNESHLQKHNDGSMHGEINNNDFGYHKTEFEEINHNELDVNHKEESFDKSEYDHQKENNHFEGSDHDFNELEIGQSHESDVGSNVNKTDSHTENNDHSSDHSGNDFNLHQQNNKTVMENNINDHNYGHDNTFGFEETYPTDEINTSGPREPIEYEDDDGFPGNNSKDKNNSHESNSKNNETPSFSEGHYLNNFDANNVLITKDGNLNLASNSTHSRAHCPIGNLTGEQIALVCPTGFRRHPKYCNLFYQCTSPIIYSYNIIVLQCPEDTAFDENKVQCLPAQELTMPCKGLKANKKFYDRLLENSIPMIPVSQNCLCPGLGHFPHHKECSSKYVKCLEGKSGSTEGYLHDCPPNQIYSPASKSCVPANRFTHCQSSQ